MRRISELFGNEEIRDNERDWLEDLDRILERIEVTFKNTEWKDSSLPKNF